MNFIDSLISTVNAAVGGLSDTITQYGVENSGGIDYIAIAELCAPVFKAFAYAFVIIFFGLSLMQSVMQYELFTPKGAVKAGSGLLLAKVWIDISIDVCKYIINIGNGIVTAIMDYFDKMNELSEPLLPTNISSKIPGADILFIGDIIEFVMSWQFLLPVILMLLVVGIISCMVQIKLIMRSFDIALLITVSPIFFACIVGDATRSYFRKFITTFLGVVMQIVFMILVCIVATYWLQDASSLSPNASIDDVINFAVGTGGRFFIIIAMGIMMIKPPKILTSLVS